MQSVSKRVGCYLGLQHGNAIPTHLKSGISITYENETGGFFTRGHEGNCRVSSSDEEVLRLDKEPVVDYLSIEGWIERPFSRLFRLSRTSVGPWVPNRGTGVVHAQRAV